MDKHARSKKKHINPEPKRPGWLTRQVPGEAKHVNYASSYDLSERARHMKNSQTFATPSGQTFPLKPQIPITLVHPVPMTRHTWWSPFYGGSLITMETPGVSHIRDITARVSSWCTKFTVGKYSIDSWILKNNLDLLINALVECANKKPPHRAWDLN